MYPTPNVLFLKTLKLQEIEYNDCMDQNHPPSSEYKEAEFKPIGDKWYDALLKKLPAGWKPDAKIFMYAGFGILIFLGIIASSATSTQTPKEPERTQNQSLPTLPPNIDVERPVSQKKFINTKYLFSFTHPGLSDQCCTIVGPTHGNSEAVGNLSNPASVRMGADAPFDGLSLYVVDLTNTNPDDYLKIEATNLKTQYQKEHGEEPKNARWQTLTVSSQSAVLLKNYNSLTVNRYYILFPDKKNLLYIGASEANLGSFNASLNAILQTLVFETASTGAQLRPQK
jgi:hypothetical protein